MNKFVKCLIAGGIVLGIGIVVLIFGLSLNSWSFKPKFTEAKYVQENKNIDSLVIDFSAGEFETVFYDGDKIEIDYYTSNIKKIDIKESGTTLSFRDRGRWWISFGVHNPPKTVIKLPQGNVYNLKIDMSAGLISISEGAYGNINVDMSAGLVKFNGEITCDKFDIDMSAGNVEVSNLECSSATIDLSAGKVGINHFSCPVIDIDLSAGAVDLGIIGTKSEYSIRVDKSAGSCNVGNQPGTSSDKKINIDISAGSVNISFDN